MTKASARPAIETLKPLLREVRACTVCAPALPLGPRPVLRVSRTARLLIASQAPGTRVHETGLPFNDRSGDRLRDWLGMPREVFYDEQRVAIVPIGLCYPGRDPRGGDRAPRPECAPLWRSRILAQLQSVSLTLLVGRYAQLWHLGAAAKSDLTQTVAAWRDYRPNFVPLPHPSWRNTGWLKRNPWFATDLLPYLRRRIRDMELTA